MLVEQVKIFIGEWEHEPGEEGEFFGFEEEINKWLNSERTGAITKMTQSIMKEKGKNYLVISFIHSAE